MYNITKVLQTRNEHRIHENYRKKKQRGMEHWFNFAKEKFMTQLDDLCMVDHNQTTFDI